MPVSNEHRRYQSKEVSAASPPGLNVKEASFSLEFRPKQMSAARCCLAASASLLPLRRISLFATEDHNHDAGVFHHLNVSSQERKSLVHCENPVQVEQASLAVMSIIGQALRRNLVVLEIVGFRFSLEAWEILCKVLPHF